MKEVLIALILLPTPGIAAEQVFEITEVTDCLEASAENPRSCIGKASSYCSENSIGGETTVGMVGCLDKELAFWDDLLNVTYKSLIDKSQVIDREAKEYGWTATPQVPALRKAQRAWIAFRDASCEYEYATWGGGTGGNPAYLSCMMTLTAEQALQLKTRLEER